MLKNIERCLLKYPFGIEKICFANWFEQKRIRIVFLPNLLAGIAQVVEGHSLSLCQKHYQLTQFDVYPPRVVQEMGVNYHHIVAGMLSQLQLQYHTDIGTVQERDLRSQEVHWAELCHSEHRGLVENSTAVWFVFTPGHVQPIKSYSIKKPVCVNK